MKTLTTWIATGLVIVLHILTSGQAADAAVVTVIANLDAFVSDTNGDGVFDIVTDSAINNMPIQRFTGVTEDRVILEFDLSSIPVGSVIVDARLLYRSIASGGVPFQVSVQGYAGDGFISLLDSITPATEIATYDALDFGLGPVDVGLDTAFLQTRIGIGSAALRLQAINDGVGTALSPSEATGTLPLPSLRLTVSAVPEPSTVLFLVACIAPIAIAKRRMKSVAPSV